jgi:hypothetical protein
MPLSRPAEKVLERNDGSVGISAMNLSMMSAMFSGTVKELLEKGAQDFEKSREGVVQ